VSGRGRDGDPKDRDEAGFDDMSMAKTAIDESTSDAPARPRRVPTARRAVIATGVRVLPLDDDDDDDDLDDEVDDDDLSDEEEFAELSVDEADVVAELDEPPPTVLSDRGKGEPATQPFNPAPQPPGKRPSVLLVDNGPPPSAQAAATAAGKPHPLESKEWQLDPGDVVGNRYTIQKPIARGGMAEVYLAEQAGVAGFSKKVVIKRILPEFVSDPLFVEHFVREATLAASLTHDHIAQVYELGQDRGSHFIAMEYIPGVSLAELSHRAWDLGRSIPVELILLAISDAAQGLVFGWRAPGPDGQPLKLVHRDVSPDNLMINAHGTTKLLDYGVAKAATSVDLTMVGEIKGKLSYIAPEMFTQNVRDHRSDLYALGVTAYWMCTAQRPFEMKHAALLVDKLVREKPPNPRSHNPLLPEAVDALIMRLLEKKPSKRFADGEALSVHIHELLGAVRRATIGSFVHEVLNPPQSRGSARPLPANAPPAVVTGERLKVPDDSAGAWDKLKSRFKK
jgi:serine/threonine protein kinase